MTVSLRVRIVALATLVVTVVLAVTAIGVVVDVRRQFLGDLDRSLQQRAEQIAAQFLMAPDNALVDSNAEDRFAQVVDPTGAVVAATSNVAGAPSLAAPPATRIVVGDRREVPIEDDTYRVLVMAISGGGHVIVGENVDDVRDDVRILTTTVAIAFPLAIALLAATMWWIVGRTLRPVESLRAEVAGIGVDELDRRLDVPPSGDEISRLATTMNDMLARLDAAVAHQRSFVADASHELRTPLTRLRTSLEVDLASADPEGELAVACRRALRDTLAMQQLVDDLLFLARHDATDPTTHARRTTPVDLDAVLDQEVLAARERAPSSCRIEVGRVTPVVVSGRAAELGRALSNLLANSQRYAASVVTVELREEDAGAVLVIDDDGPGIAPADRERVFGRFERPDAPRRAADGGAGLGLAITRDIVTAHQGTVVLEESPLGGTRARVVLPLA